MSHTPGPWEAQNTNKGIYIRGGEPGYLAQVRWYKTDSDLIWANANLIAAAPDLLEACEAVR